MRIIRLLPWLFALYAGSAPLALAQPAAANWGLAQLMHELSKVRSASASFTERKTVQVLNAPLVASGSLSYVAPDYIRKTTLRPVPENFVLDHGQITISGGPDQQTHVFSLNADPRIGGLVEGIRAALAGDLPALDRLYTVQLSGSAADWQLLLQPKNPGVAQMIKWIIIRGQQDHLDGLDTASGNGDHSEMSIAEDVSDAQ